MTNNELMKGLLDNIQPTLKANSATYDKVKPCTYRQRLALRLHAKQYQRQGQHWEARA